jgi:hypothetical protein
MKRTFISLLLAVLYPSSVNAAVTVNVVEDGANVVATVSGSVNTDVFSTFNPADAPGSWFRGSSYQPGFALSGFGIGRSTPVYVYPLNPTSTIFSTGGNYTTFGGVGTLFGIGVGDSASDTLILPQSYVSGSAISSSATFLNQSFASMGLIEGTYEFSWSSGDDRDIATLTIGGVLPPPPPPPVREYSGLLPSGATGTLSFVTDDGGCEFDGDPEFLSIDSIPAPAPPGLEPIDGVVQFTVTSCTPGATVAFTMDYGATVPEGSRYWKAGDTWREIPAAINGSQVEFSITDGGNFDADGLVNGQIVDPSGAATGSPGTPRGPAVSRGISPGADSTEATPVPTMSAYGLALAALGLLVVAGRRLESKINRS